MGLSLGEGEGKSRGEAGEGEVGGCKGRGYFGEVICISEIMVLC